MEMLIKYKAGDVAKDLNLPAKQVLDLLTEKFGEQKKHTSPLNEQELNYKLLSEQQRIDGYQYKFNEKVILRADAETQMKTLTSAVNNGIYTPNEARQYLDLPSKDGGDQLIVNGNYVPLTSVGAAYGISKEGGSGE